MTAPEPSSQIPPASQDLATLATAAAVGLSTAVACLARELAAVGPEHAAAVARALSLMDEACEQHAEHPSTPMLAATARDIRTMLAG